jgi:hypothetical protein
MDLNIVAPISPLVMNWWYIGWHILNHVTGLHILIQNHVCIWNKRTMPRYRVSLHPDFSIFLKEKKKIKIKETPQKTVDEPPNSNDWPRWLFHVYIYDDIISDITQRGRSVSIYREDWELVHCFPHQYTINNYYHWNKFFFLLLNPPPTISPDIVRT